MSSSQSWSAKFDLEIFACGLNYLPIGTSHGPFEGAVNSATEQVQSPGRRAPLWIVSGMVVREYLEEGNRFFFMRRTPFGRFRLTRH